MKNNDKEVRMKIVNLALKILWTIIFFEEIVVAYFFINKVQIFYSLIIILIINVIFGFLIKKPNKLISILFILYLMILFFVPIYNTSYTYAPTGPNSHLMGLAYAEEIRNIYGVNIAKIVKIK